MEIILKLAIEEEEEVIISEEDLIIFIIGGLNTKLQIANLDFRITAILKQMLQRISTKILVSILIIQKKKLFLASNNVMEDQNI